MDRTPDDEPRVLVDTGAYAGAVGEQGVAGAVWKLTAVERDLDANLVALPPDERIEVHVGAEVDVLVHVLAGSGRLITPAGAADLHVGALLWLPRRSRRGFVAGPGGLRYLTVHRRRQALKLGLRPPDDT